MSILLETHTGGRSLNKEASGQSDRCCFDCTLVRDSRGQRTVGSRCASISVLFLGRTKTNGDELDLDEEVTLQNAAAKKRGMFPLQPGLY